MEHSLTDLDALGTQIMVEPEPEQITLPGELHSSVYGAPSPASISMGADSTASSDWDKSLVKKLHPTVVRGLAVLAARTRSTRAAKNTADQLRNTLDIDQLKKQALAEGVDAHAVEQSESREQLIHMIVEQKHRLYAQSELRELNSSCAEPSKTGTDQDQQAGQTKPGKYWWDQLRQKLSTVGELSLFLHDDVKKLYANDGSDREELSEGPSDQASIKYEDTALSKAERALKAAERKRYFFVPHDKRRQIWDLVLCVLLIYVGVMIPVRIGFEVTLELGDLGFAVDVVVDFLFACDIALNLRTGFYDELGFMVSDPIVVAKRYFKGWGCIDVVSSLPITYVLLIAGQTDNGNTSLKGVRMLRLIRLTKLLRLLRLKSIFDRYAEELEPFLRSLSIVRILMMNVFIAHICACMWHWVALPYGSESWLKDNLELDDDLSTKYTTSFYWSMTTLSTVGYGDISATNSAEQRLTVVTELMGTTAFAYMAGTLSSIVMAAGLNEQEYNQKMGAIREYLRVKKVNKGMRRRIGKYFENLYERKTAFDEGQVLGMMPPMMSRQVINEVYREFTSTMLLFRGLSEACITKLCLELRPYKAFGPVREVRKVVKGVDNGWIWAADKTPVDTAILGKIDLAFTKGKHAFVWPKEIEPGEVLSHEHEEATELFIIHSGKCSVYSGGIRLGDLHAGAFFGETAMVGLGGGPDGKSHTRTVRACQDMSLSFLTRESLDAIAESHPELQERLHKFAKYRYEKDQKKVRAENLAKILPNAKEARRAFKKAIKQHDQNGDGTLAADEMDKVLQSFGIKLTENDLHAFMDEIDTTDADGQISEEEFVRCFERLKETGEDGPTDGIYRLIARMASYATHVGGHQQGIPHHTYKGKFMPGSQLRTTHFPHPGSSKQVGLTNTASKAQSNPSGSSRNSEMQLEKLTAAITMLTSKVEAIERRLS